MQPSLSNPSADLPAESGYQTPASEDSLDNLEVGLQSLLKHLHGNPEVAYVIGSIKKGLAGVDVAALSPEEKQSLLDKVQQLLEESPTVLQALREFRG
jgi:hypothetical protein